MTIPQFIIHLRQIVQYGYVEPYRTGAYDEHLRYRDSRSGGSSCHCPLSLVASALYPAQTFSWAEPIRAARVLGLDYVDGVRIADAADYERQTIKNARIRQMLIRVSTKFPKSLGRHARKPNLN